MSRSFAAIVIVITIVNFILVSYAQERKTTSEKLPDIGTAAVSALTIDKEMAIGDLVMRRSKPGGVWQTRTARLSTRYRQPIGSAV